LGCGAPVGGCGCGRRAGVASSAGDGPGVRPGIAWPDGGVGGGELGKDRSQITRTLKALAGKGLVEATDTKPATWQATNKEQA
jgi:hypothetical protein